MAKATILIVEEDRCITRILDVLLEGGGYDVLTADNGITGLEMARTRHPQLIITEVVLPGLDGFGLCSKIKADPTTSGIHVIFLTEAMAWRTDREYGLSVGADEYLTAPFNLHHLAECIGTHLGHVVPVPLTGG